jgi:chemosensory pili system protein ChpE
MNIFIGAILAIVYIISPGPVIVETVHRGVLGGFRGAFLLQLGALIADLLLACLTLYGITQFMGNTSMQFSLSMAEMSFLVILGLLSLRQGWHITLSTVRSPTSDVDIVLPVPGRANLGHFLVGLGLALANPYGIFFWMSVEHMMLHSSSHMMYFLFGFFLSGVVVSLIIAKLVSLSARRITPGILRLTSFSLGLLLIGMGLNLGYAALLHP